MRPNIWCAIASGFAPSHRLARLRRLCQFHHQRVISDPPMADILAFISRLGQGTARDFWQVVSRYDSSQWSVDKSLAGRAMVFCALASIDDCFSSIACPNWSRSVIVPGQGSPERNVAGGQKKSPAKIITRIRRYCADSTGKEDSACLANYWKRDGEGVAAG